MTTPNSKNKDNKTEKDNPYVKVENLIFSMLIEIAPKMTGIVEANQELVLLKIENLKLQNDWLKAPIAKEQTPSS